MIEINVDLGPIAQLRVSGSTTQEVLAQLTDVQRSEIPTVLGQVERLLESAQVGERLGRELGAERVAEWPKVEEQAEAPQSDPLRESQQRSLDDRGWTIEEEPMPDWAQRAPGAPLVGGQPAWYTTWTDTNTGRPKQAFVQPSIKMDTTKPTTQDPTDPRLATGEVWFYSEL